MGVWPVLLPIAMYQDHGNRFAVGDEIAWEVLLVDGEQQGWPTQRLVETSARIVPRPEPATHGSLADTGTMRVCWRGPEAVGSVLPPKAGLVADSWNPPIPTTMRATIYRIEVVSRRAALDRSGVWMPTGAWWLTPVQAHAAAQVAQPNDPGAEHDGGLLLTVEVASCTITYGSMGIGGGDPGNGHGSSEHAPARSTRASDSSLSSAQRRASKPRSTVLLVADCRAGTTACRSAAVPRHAASRTRKSGASPPAAAALRVGR